MKLFLKLGILICIFLSLNVDSIKASDVVSDAISICQQEIPDKENSFSSAQSISSIKITIPRCVEYSFNLQRLKIKNASFNKLLLHIKEVCKTLQPLHLEKGYVYNVVHYVRHTSKYYIFAIRHILI